MTRWIDKSGYVRLHDKKLTGVNTIAEHRFVMEKYLGRKLDSLEHIHHINHNKSDNRIENLEIISPADHKRFHQHERFARYYAGRWSENYDACVVCGLTEKVHAKEGVCFRCYDREKAKERRIKKGHIPREERNKFWG